MVACNSRRYADTSRSGSGTVSHRRQPSCDMPTSWRRCEPEPDPFGHRRGEPKNTLSPQIGDEQKK